MVDRDRARGVASRDLLLAAVAGLALVALAAGGGLLRLLLVTTAAAFGLECVHAGARAAAARAMGFREPAVQLGRGPAIAVHVARLRTVELCALPLAGASWLDSDRRAGWRRRAANVWLSSLAFEAVAAVLACALITADRRAIALAFGSRFVSSFLPWPAKLDVGPGYPAGIAILRILSVRRHEFARQIVGDQSLQAVRDLIASARAGADSDAALDAALAAVTDDPSSVEGRRDLGVALAHAGHYRQARAQLEWALTRSMPASERALAKSNLAYVSLLCGDPSFLGEAMHLSREAFDALPLEPAVVNTRGAALALAGDFTAARELLAAVRAVNPHSAAPLALLALCAFGEGDPGTALALCSQAQQLDSSEPWLAWVHQAFSARRTGAAQSSSAQSSLA